MKKLIKPKETGNIRRVMALLLTAALTVGSLSGCGKSKGENGGSSPAKGRYVENDIELPVQDGESILSLQRSKEGNLVLFSNFEDTQVNRYEYIDGTWEASSLDWLKSVFGEQEIYTLDAKETEDGTQIVAGIDENLLTHIVRSEDGKTGEELDISYLKQQTDYGYPAVFKLLIDGAGNYWLQDMYQSKLVVVAPDTLEAVQEINSAQSFSVSQSLMFRDTEGNVAANTEEGTYTIYDKDLGEQGSIQLEKQESVCMCGDGKNWYLFSEDGITRLSVGNDIREVIMDGSMGTMGAPTNIPCEAVTDGEDSFYVLYHQEKAQAYSLKHYVYDADIEAVPEKTLQVFGLSENDTVRQAIAGFQKEHPEVKVEFQTSDKSAGAVSQDDIRTLNTELLSGNGADVLLLDGLPVDAYIEKGILTDLTDLSEELMEQDAYLEAMMKNTVQKDGKVYGLPVKFSVPIIYGNEDSKAALESLESLGAYLEEHPDASIFGIADRYYIRDFLFQMYQTELLGEDGKVMQEKLTELLEIEEKLMTNANAAVFEDEFNIAYSGAEVPEKTVFTNYGDTAIVNHPDAAATSYISCLADMMIPYAVMRQMGITADTLKGMYDPNGIVGINKNSEQQELAREFVKYLFSEEVQSAQLDDGFPVLVSALDQQKQEAESSYAQSFSMVSSWSIEGENEIEIEAGYPTVEEVEHLIEQCKALTKSSEQDQIIWNIYRTEADQYLGGSMDAETAAKNVAQKVDTYLAE